MTEAQINQSSGSSSLDSLMHKVTNDDPFRAHLLLLSGDENDNQMPGIIGVYFPAKFNENAPETLKNEASHAQFFFQLRPCFKLFRLCGEEQTSHSWPPGTPAGKTDDGAPAEYWIGNPEVSQVSLKIDFTTKEAMLVQNKTATEHDPAIYEDMTCKRESARGGDEPENKSTQASREVTWGAVYRVVNGDDEHASLSRQDAYCEELGLPMTQRTRLEALLSANP
ncbi:hypothetical protein N7492_008310 [Penicillium capsulatum]|uniref:Uncharacterized protein n=1 Tax=Penicillium capsulatum TaxID=69766 RepID=A0A9W9HRF7_9EURO|nr:hypothetical protein N7492_008310 [Penicillium capsulatum]